MPTDTESTKLSRRSSWLRFARSVFGAVGAVVLITVGVTLFRYEPTEPVGHFVPNMPVWVEPLPTASIPSTAVPTSVPSAPLPR